VEPWVCALLRDSISTKFGTRAYDLGAELLQLGIIAETEVDHFLVCEVSLQGPTRQYEVMGVASECGSRELAVAGGRRRSRSRSQDTRNVQLEMKLIKLRVCGSTLASVFSRPRMCCISM
jgi:hypothetical protein